MIGAQLIGDLSDVFQSALNVRHFVRLFRRVNTGKIQHIQWSMNSSFDWNQHISLVSSKVNKTTGILRYVQQELPENIVRTIYFTLVNP